MTDSVKFDYDEFETWFQTEYQRVVTHIRLNDSAKCLTIFESGKISRGYYPFEGSEKMIFYSHTFPSKSKNTEKEIIPYCSASTLIMIREFVAQIELKLSVANHDSSVAFSKWWRQKNNKEQSEKSESSGLWWVMIGLLTLAVSPPLFCILIMFLFCNWAFKD